MGSSDATIRVSLLLLLDWRQAECMVLSAFIVRMFRLWAHVNAVRAQREVRSRSGSVSDRPS